MQNSYQFIDIMPYSKKAIINSLPLKLRVMRIACTLLQLMKKAFVEFYIHKNISVFDPHVGENLCQIRACYVLELQKKLAKSPETTQKVYKLLNQINSSIAKLQQAIKADVNILALPNHLKKRRYFLQVDLSVLFDLFNLNIIFSSEHIYLFLSYFLSEYKTINLLENIVLDYKKLKSHLDASKNICRRLVHQYQVMLANVSTQYIAQITQPAFDKDILSCLMLQDEEGRVALPCFTVMSLLLKRMLLLEIPILLIVRSNAQPVVEQTALFGVTNGAYQFVQSQEVAEQQACISFYILTDASIGSHKEWGRFLNQIDRLALENLIMASMAVHPQYSGKKSNVIKEDPYAWLLSEAQAGQFSQLEQMHKELLVYKQLIDDLNRNNNGIFITIRHISASYTDLKHYYCQAKEELLGLLA